MKTGYKVSDAMTQNPIFISQNKTVVEGAKKMKENKVGGIVVKDGEDIVGVCTEHDLTYKIIAENKDPSKILMKDIMTSNLKTIEHDKDIFEAIMKMRDLNIRRLPVMNNDKFVGLLTMKDVLKIEPQLFEIIIDTIELREEENKPISISNAEDEVEEIINRK